ncbi:hypothetical protein CVT26_000584 [Gymnopilus dilepis]|uniref:Uncharacterized protein n=1 Tax=Gymnopilus dilepis TaxID=231916 RepID=A0A409VH85_9AGAR|nr:hypothetical protein CVT26_000584 [Gymnopilus dilepis]
MVSSVQLVKAQSKNAFKADIYLLVINDSLNPSNRPLYDTDKILKTLQHKYQPIFHQAIGQGFLKHLENLCANAYGDVFADRGREDSTEPSDGSPAAALLDVDALFSKAPIGISKYKDVFKTFIANDTDLFAAFRLLHPDAIVRFVDVVIASDKRVPVTKKERSQLIVLFSAALLATC